MKIDANDRAALRRCAEICWKARAELGLSDQDVEQVLIAWMAIGTDEEGAAASGVLAARRESDARQVRFDDLLGGGGKST